VNRARLFDALGVRDDEALAAALRSATADEVARQRRILAATLANAANALDPSTVVLGGFLAALRGADPTGFDDAVRAQMLEAPAEGMTVAAAALGADRLLTGAAELVFEQLMADPIG
ncbi:ROK family protein, partial [Microbacterium gubbeenense]